MRAVAIVLMALTVCPAVAQSPPNLVALQGLAPQTMLRHTPAGQAALAANYAVTGSIQTGQTRLPILPFAQQQRAAVRDAFITSANANQLGDALGSRLGGVYQSMTGYTSAKVYASISPNLRTLFTYTNAITGSDSNAAKYFFANGTTDGTAPVSPAAAAILAQAGGETDVFGKAYGHPAGQIGADPFGNSRPFQTEPKVLWIDAPDYFGAASSNTDYLYGPLQDLTDSPSFPSGHTTYGTMESVLLALLVPERYQQAVTRGAEYGNERIVLGAHYAMDVLAGRTLALHDVAQLLAHNPIYLNRTERGAPAVADYRALLAAARADLAVALQRGCGASVPVCALQDTGRFHDPAANAALNRATQTYGLPVVHPATAAMVEDVGTIAPEAGYLLTAAFPSLTLQQADDILTATEGPGGGFLDDGSAFGLYSRLNLYEAAGRAQDAARR